MSTPKISTFRSPPDSAFSPPHLSLPLTFHLLTPPAGQRLDAGASTAGGSRHERECGGRRPARARVWAARRAAAGDGLRQPGVGQGARPGTRKAAVGRLCGGGAVARSGDGGARSGPSLLSPVPCPLMPDPATAVRSAVAGVRGGGGRARLRGVEARGAEVASCWCAGRQRWSAAGRRWSAAKRCGGARVARAWLDGGNGCWRRLLFFFKPKIR